MLATVMGVVGAHNIYLSGVVGIIAKALRKLALRKLTLTCGSGGLISEAPRSQLVKYAPAVGMSYRVVCVELAICR